MRLVYGDRPIVPGKATRSMSRQDRQAEPAERPKPRLRPNVFARLARFCFRHGLIIIAAWIALAIPALVFAVTAMKSKTTHTT